MGDGTLLSKEVVEDLHRYMLENQCAFKWHNGDFVIVDNTVAYHSRQKFEGRRVVYAGIANQKKEIQFKQPVLSLHSGDQMPQVGLGLWKLGKDDCQRVVYNAIKAGYRCFDGACDYGNEKEVGLGIAQALSENLVTRDQLWITSKLWNTFHRAEHVKAACQKSLSDFGLEYFDLYLIHFPIALKFVPFEKRYPPEWIYDPQAKFPQMEEDNVSFEETWKAMEKLVEEGLVRNIGVCNVGVSLLRDVCNYAKIQPAVNQVEMHPHNTQERLLQFCR